MASILVIDDNESIRDLLKDVLVMMGFAVDVAKNGEEGIQLLHAHHLYDAVLTDVEMPGKGEDDVARFIRHSDRPDTPVLAITAVEDSRFQRHLYDLTLKKPSTLQDLKSALYRLLK